MADAEIVLGRILAIRVDCQACGDEQRFAPPPWELDEFTHRVLDPLTCWWIGHRRPRFLLFEVVANGEYAEWKAVGS